MKAWGMPDATLDLARLLISPESNLKEIDAFEDAANAIACGYINLEAQNKALWELVGDYQDTGFSVIMGCTPHEQGNHISCVQSWRIKRLAESVAAIQKAWEAR